MVSELELGKSLPMLSNQNYNYKDYSFKWNWNYNYYSQRFMTKTETVSIITKMVQELALDL